MPHMVNGAFTVLVPNNLDRRSINRVPSVEIQPESL